MKASERSAQQVLRGQRSGPTPGTAAGGHTPGHPWANGSNSERALEEEEKMRPTKVPKASPSYINTLSQLPR